MGICLLGPTNGVVCSGHGDPNLDSVTCNCNAGYSGKFCESGSGSSSNSVATGFGVTAGVLGALVLGVWGYAKYGGGADNVAKAGRFAWGLGESAVALPRKLIGGRSSYKNVGMGSGSGMGAVRNPISEGGAAASASTSFGSSSGYGAA